MLRVIFDTNIYGLLIKEKDLYSIQKKICADKEFIIYGYKPIRKELRNTNKIKRQGKLKTRNLLLNLYDELTKGCYSKDSINIHNLAFKFYKLYRVYGGICNWNKSNINIDFMIVAYACFYKLYIIISNDAKTLLNKNAQKAYRQICLEENLRLPNFWTYSELKNKYDF
ncbi:MAG: hypothetical protein ABIF40_01225 [archaeon]